MSSQRDNWPDFEKLGVPNNWGRWGDEDERGTANLLNAGLVKAAARLIENGTVYSLAAPLSPDGPNLPSRRPTWHVVTTRRRPDNVLSGADDVVMMHTHGTTHIDALCHIYMGDTLYNGHSSHKILPTGAQKCGIQNVGPMVGRGILLDIAGFRGVPHLSDGEAIEPDELDACAAKQGVAIQPGDTVLDSHGVVATLHERRRGAAAAFLRLGARPERRVRPVVQGARHRRPRWGQSGRRGRPLLGGYAAVASGGDLGLRRLPRRIPRSGAPRRRQGLSVPLRRHPAPPRRRHRQPNRASGDHLNTIRFPLPLHRP